MSNYEQDYKSLKLLNEAQVAAFSKVEVDNSMLAARNLFLEQQLANVAGALDVNRQIMRDALTKQNEDALKYNLEIQNDKAEIAELKKTQCKCKKAGD